MQKLKEQPAPLVLRVLQNPNFHLSLIGLLMALVVGYILYSQSEVVSREVRTLLDLPISSREAGEPEADLVPQPVAVSSESARPRRTKLESEDAVAAVAATETRDQAPPEPKANAPKILELSSFEVPRETLIGLLQVAEKITEGTAGRAFYFPQGQSIAEAIQKNSRKLLSAKTTPLQNGSQLELETPPTATEAFQFALFAQQTKWDGKDGQLRFEANLALPQAETPQEAALPALKTVIDMNLAGAAPLNSQGLIVILIEPANRSPRAEFLTKAGEGPWTVFQSEEFRLGASDWAILIQIK